MCAPPVTAATVHAAALTHTPRRWRALLLVWLLLLLVAAFAVAAAAAAADDDDDVDDHTVACAHSDADMRARLYAQVNATTRQWPRTDDNDNDKNDSNNVTTWFAPIRIHVDTSNLDRDDVICTAAGQQRHDMLGGHVTCDDADVVDDDVRDFLVQHVLVRATYAVQRVLDVRHRRRRQQQGDNDDNNDDDTPRRVARGACGPDMPIPPAHTRVGVARADVVVYALAVPTTRATHNTIAWAGYCSLDTHDDERPVVARLNVVPRPLRRMLRLQQERQEQEQLQPVQRRRGGVDEATRVARDAAARARDIDRYVRYVLHELLHALGFAPPFLTRASRPVRIGSNNNNNNDKTTTTAGSARVERVRYAVTAAPVVAAARALLSCASLDGVALEAEGGAGTAGMHWERRVYRDELMVGVPSMSTAALSRLTLTFLSTLPFYHVHLSYAQPMTWGSDAGCAFASPSPSSCHVTTLPQQQRPYWCRHYDDNDNDNDDTSHATLQCTYDYRSLGTCRRAATLARGQAATLLMEGCAAIEALPHMHCSGLLPPRRRQGQSRATTTHDDDNDEYATSTTQERQQRLRTLAYVGAQSRCVRTHDLQPLQQPTYDGDDDVVAAAPSPHDTSAMCTRVRCTYNDNNVSSNNTSKQRGGARVHVLLGDVWLSCPDDGAAQWLDVPPSSGLRGRVWCAAASTLCTPALFPEPDRLAAATTTAVVTHAHDDDDDAAAAMLREYVVTLRLPMTWPTTRVPPTLRRPHDGNKRAREHAHDDNDDDVAWRRACSVVTCCGGALHVAALRDVSRLLRVDVDAHVGARTGALRALSPAIAVVLAGDDENNNDNDRLRVLVSLPLAVTAPSAVALQRVLATYTHTLQRATHASLPHLGYVASHVEHTTLSSPSATEAATCAVCRDVDVGTATTVHDSDAATTMTLQRGASFVAGERGSGAPVVLDGAAVVLPPDVLAVASVHMTLRVACDDDKDDDASRVCARARAVAASAVPADATAAATSLSSSSTIVAQGQLLTVALCRDTAALLGVTDSMLRVQHVTMRTTSSSNDSDDGDEVSMPPPQQQQVTASFVLRVHVVAYLPSSLLDGGDDEDATRAAHVRAQWQRRLQREAQQQRQQRHTPSPSRRRLLPYTTRALRTPRTHASTLTVALVRAAVTSPTATAMRDVVATGLCASANGCNNNDDDNNNNHNDDRTTRRDARCGARTVASLLLPSPRPLLHCLRTRRRDACGHCDADVVALLVVLLVVTALVVALLAMTTTKLTKLTKMTSDAVRVGRIDNTRAHTNVA